MNSSDFGTGHVGLNVRDLERSKRFYQQVFGFQVQGESLAPGRRFAFLGDAERVVLTLWEQGEKAFSRSDSGLHHLSFQVPRLELVQLAERRLLELGVRLLYDGIVAHAEGTDSGGVHFEDPDGIRLEIYGPSGAAGRPAPTADGPSCGFF